MVFKFCLRVIIFVQLVFTANSYSLKSLSSGCSAHECKRTCFGSNTSPTPGDNGFKIMIEDLPDKRYIPNKDYKSK